MSQSDYEDNEYFALDEGFLDKPTFKLIKDWKTRNEKNRIKKFKSSSVTPEEASELKEEISIMRTDDIDYETYKKAFHKFCTFIHTIDKGVIIKTIRLDKNKTDDNYTLYVEYADNTKKIKLPDDCKLYHISKVGGIRKLLPFFKGKSAKGYLYDKPRIYLTIRKKMPKFLADYKVNEKMYTYECKKDIKEVYVDPLVPSFIQGAVYIETQNPVDVEEVGMKAGTNDEEKVEAKNEAYEAFLYDDEDIITEGGEFDFDSFFEMVMEFGLEPVDEDEEFIDDTEDVLEDDDEEDEDDDNAPIDDEDYAEEIGDEEEWEDDDEGIDVEDILPKSGMPSENDVIQESKKFLGYGGTKKIEKKYNIPDEYCIQRRDVMYAKIKDNIAKKVEKAIGYIKDNDDLNKYFTPLLKSLFFNMMIFKDADLNKYPNVKKVYNLYKKSYKGDNPIDLNKLYTSSAAKFNAILVPVTTAGASVGAAAVAAMRHEATEETEDKKDDGSEDSVDEALIPSLVKNMRAGHNKAEDNTSITRKMDVPSDDELVYVFALTDGEKKESKKVIDKFKKDAAKIVDNMNRSKAMVEALQTAIFTNLCPFKRDYMNDHPDDNLPDPSKDAKAKFVFTVDDIGDNYIDFRVLDKSIYTAIGECEEIARKYKLMMHPDDYAGYCDLLDEVCAEAGKIICSQLSKALPEGLLLDMDDADCLDDIDVTVAAKRRYGDIKGTGIAFYKIK